jgi:hypothetical protein
MKNFTREQLLSRHHLSHQQIDRLLDEKESSNHPELKGQILHKLAHFIDVSKLFSREGIRFVPFKGPLLSLRLYNDPSFRYYSDLDFLMDFDSAKRAFAILLDAGFESPYFTWPNNADKEKRLESRTNQVLLFHPGKNIRVELHWQLFKHHWIGNNKINDLIQENLAEVEYAEQSFTVFSKEFELVYLIIHGGLHGWQWLKWLVDIRDFVAETGYDIAKFNQIVHQLGASRLVALCNSLLEEFFPESRKLPQEASVSNYLLRYSIKKINAPEGSSGTSFFGLFSLIVYRMRCFPGLSYKCRVMKTFLFCFDQIDAENTSSVAMNNASRIIKKLFRRFK